MQKIFGAIIALFFGVSIGMCQTNLAVKKIWAWEVTSVGGAQIDPSMGGEQFSNIYHLIYLETIPDCKIENITIWFKNGFVYTAKTQKITSYPVTLNGKEVLIKKNRNRLLECILNKIDILHIPKKIKNFFVTNEMVVEYMVNKKSYFLALKIVPKKTQELM